MSISDYTGFMPKQFPQDITKPLAIPFSIGSFGLYALKIVARCQSGDSLGFRGGEDLRIEIDDLKFREIPPKDKPQYYNIPSAWNGTELKGLAKTIYFILPLNKGTHTLTFIPNKRARIESLETQPIKDLRNIVFELNEKAEDGDRRPWYTFALINLPLKSVSADVSVSWHFLDGDDVKLIIDNKVEENVGLRLWRHWVWSARPWDIFGGAKRELKTFAPNLAKDTHYIEFWADKSPIIHQIIFDLGDFVLKRIPTVEDPGWTGDFRDDTDQILLARLILGEMEGESNEAKLGVGFSVLNRLRKRNPSWGDTLKEVILKENQYDAFENEKTLKKVRNPLKNVAKSEWVGCYEIATAMLLGESKDPTDGATHFFSASAGSAFPSWATESAFKIKIGITSFYELNS